ncbi:hypothetical protein [Sorangium sp. So ce854]|uniref:hypothetical protein n=1 Tax=Sorangium sp. So ce854 TaxID=3133322 RepID=UPI003F5F8510
MRRQQRRALPLAPGTLYTPAVLEGIADGERWLARLPVFAAARDAEWQEARRREA